MSDTVTLTANNVSAQSVRASATVTDNGSPIFPSIVWSSSNTSVATVNDVGTVQGIADPSGSGSKTANIVATALDGNGNPIGSGFGVVTVVTSGDTVVVTVSFGTPS